MVAGIEANCEYFLAAAALAARCVFFSFYPNLDNIGRSTNPRINFEGAGRAVVYARAAFHASVKIDNNGLFAVHFQDILRADIGAKAAADAFFRI
jgi:hypothetical protein